MTDITMSELLRLLRSGCAVTPHQIQAAEELEYLLEGMKAINRTSDCQLALGVSRRCLESGTLGEEVEDE